MNSLINQHDPESGVQKTRARSRGGDSYSYPPRGLCREEAARYVGVGASLFDQMVKDRRMPPPKRVNSRTVWDRVQLDAYFTDLPSDEDNEIDALLNKAKRGV